MTLFENMFPEYVEEFAAERLRRKHLGSFDGLEQLQNESDSYKAVFQKDAYSELRFLRK